MLSLVTNFVRASRLWIRGLLSGICQNDVWVFKNHVSDPDSLLHSRGNKRQYALECQSLWHTLVCMAESHLWDSVRMLKRQATQATSHKPWLNRAAANDLIGLQSTTSLISTRAEQWNTCCWTCWTRMSIWRRSKRYAWKWSHWDLDQLLTGKPIWTQGSLLCDFQYPHRS